MLARLRASFFARPCLQVAPDLLGCHLVHGTGGERRVGRIVEVEAYLGDGSDPASHAHDGPTARNRAMFGPPGRFYVYRSMGIHFCMNVVCEKAGVGAAVLVRAVEPLEGIDRMRSARGGRPDRELANGPGKLTQAFGIGLEHNRVSALRGALRIEAPGEPVRTASRAGPRIGISKARHLPYRFFFDGNPWVGRPPRTAARDGRALPSRAMHSRAPAR